eukprot:353171-Chlamydomonas_euryale.AAC.12
MPRGLRLIPHQPSNSPPGFRLWKYLSKQILVVASMQGPLPVGVGVRQAARFSRRLISPSLARGRSKVAPSQTGEASRRPYQSHHGVASARVRRGPPVSVEARSPCDIPHAHLLRARLFSARRQRTLAASNPAANAATNSVALQQHENTKRKTKPFFPTAVRQAGGRVVASGSLLAHRRETPRRKT